MGQLSNLNTDLVNALIRLIDICSGWFFLIVIAFNCSLSFVLSWVDRAITGTWSFVSVIANVIALSAIGLLTKLT